MKHLPPLTLLPVPAATTLPALQPPLACAGCPPHERPTVLRAQELAAQPGTAVTAYGPFAAAPGRLVECVDWDVQGPKPDVIRPCVVKGDTDSGGCGIHDHVNGLVPQHRARFKAVVCLHRGRLHRVVACSHFRVNSHAACAKVPQHGLLQMLGLHDYDAQSEWGVEPWADPGATDVHDAPPAGEAPAQDPVPWVGAGQLAQSGLPALACPGIPRGPSDDSKRRDYSQEP
mmetsp:Transcript_29673/g.81692  ORF Transcript_29673/g.81692 Transcript_29673/m.81692 type:complete len:230 (+) Transcript_29673:565-1254(+)